MEIILLIIGIIIVISIIRSALSWISEHIVGIIIFAAIVAIITLLFFALKNPIVWIFIAIGIVVIIIYYKNCRKTRAKKSYSEVFDFIYSQYSHNRRKWQLSLDSIIYECNKNSSIKKAIETLRGDTTVNNIESDKEIICLFVSQIETMYVKDYLVEKIQRVGAFTKSEAVEYCLKEMDFLSTASSSISEKVANEIVQLVAEHKLLRKPIGTDDILYTNGTGAGRKLQTRYIELT